MKTMSADAVVIGGGLIACSIAWRLAQENLHVVMLEKARPGSEKDRSSRSGRIGVV